MFDAAQEANLHCDRFKQPWSGRSKGHNARIVLSLAESEASCHPALFSRVLECA